jgi:hypothetical protein
MYAMDKAKITVKIIFGVIGGAITGCLIFLGMLFISPILMFYLPLLFHLEWTLTHNYIVAILCGSGVAAAVIFHDSVKTWWESIGQSQ